MQNSLSFYLFMSTSRKNEFLARGLLGIELKFFKVGAIFYTAAYAFELRWHMNQIRVFKNVNNLEIISKIMNSVARQCGCRVKYDAEQKAICFYGDTNYQKYIAEQTLEFFRPI